MGLPAFIFAGRFKPFNLHSAAPKLPTPAPQLFADFLGSERADVELVAVSDHYSAQLGFTDFSPRPSLGKELAELEQGVLEGVQVQAFDWQKINFIQSWSGWDDGCCIVCFSYCNDIVHNGLDSLGPASFVFCLAGFGDLFISWDQPPSIDLVRGA
jgi:hypothetical protein